MLDRVDAVLHRIEALPGDGRYAVTFRRDDGGEQTAVMQTSGEALDVAEASLPIGWTRESASFLATRDAVLAVHAARSAVSSGSRLRDVEGGWDVGLGNVVLGSDGVPECTGHGPMSEAGGVWTCAECGAQALL